MENDIFWSEIGSGFGEQGGTPPPRIPSSTPPPSGNELDSNDEAPLKGISKIRKSNITISSKDTLIKALFWSLHIKNDSGTNSHWSADWKTHS